MKTQTIIYNLIQLVLFGLLWSVLRKYGVEPISWDALWILVIIALIALNDKYLSN